jgi:hypothetical protein
MTADFDPIRPVQPAWPGRAVPEKGDEKRRRPPSPRDGDGDKGPASGDEGGRGEEQRRPGREDSSGPHVDEYV